jgi:hypothetical protein
MLNVILYCFTKNVLTLPDRVIKRSSVTGKFEPSKQSVTEIIGDLARLSYLYNIGVNRTVAETSDSSGYLNIDYSENKAFPVVTMGDSFMYYNGDSERFSTLLQNILKENCYNMSANGVEDPFTFFQNDLVKKPKVVVWGFVERNINSRDFNPERINLYYTSSKKKIDYAEKWERNNFKKQFRLINSSNFKFLLNNLSYYLAGKPLLGEANIVKLKSGRELLFYKNDLTSFNRQSFTEELNLCVQFITYVNEEFKKRGITLIFVAAPDKYDAYYNEILDEQKISCDTDFLYLLSQELRGKNVIAISFTDVFRKRISEGNHLYHFDDTHWNIEGAQIAAELVAEEIRDRHLLD